MSDSQWENPDWLGTSRKATSPDYVVEYLYDIRSELERLRHTVVGIGTVIIIMLIATTWFV